MFYDKIQIVLIGEPGARYAIFSRVFGILNSQLNETLVIYDAYNVDFFLILEQDVKKI